MLNLGFPAGIDGFQAGLHAEIVKMNSVNFNNNTFAATNARPSTSFSTNTDSPIWYRYA